MDHCFRDKETWPMSQAELVWYMAPPFVFTHNLCMNASRRPIPRGPETAATVVRLQKVTDMCLHICRIRPCQPMERWFRTDTPLVLVSSWMLVLWAARPLCRTWCCWLRCLLDLVRTRWGGEPGGRVTRDGSPSVCDGGCLWPSLWPFWGVRLPPHGCRHTSPGALVWVYLGFWQGCLQALIDKAKEGKKVFNTFFSILFPLPFFLPPCYLIGSPPQVGRGLILSFWLQWKPSTALLCPHLILHPLLFQRSLELFVFEAQLMGTEPVLLSNRCSIMEQPFFFFAFLLSFFLTH